MKLYLCDPEKNNGCEKTYCQNPCMHTTDKRYRANLLKRIFSKTRELKVPEVASNADTRKENMDA